MTFSLSRKTTSEFFQLSWRARGLCCKNEVMLHKTYLAICSDANKSASKGGALSSRNVCFQSHEIPTYRLLQSYYLLSPKPLKETKPQITKSKPQVRTKENHADYSIIEPYICIVEYVGGGMCLR